MDTKELEQIIENHRHWLDEDVGGWEAMRANLSSTNLRNANLRGADLTGADLIDVDLRDVNLRGANLRGVDLGVANLRGADLCGANLRGANLIDADLRAVNLRGADLRGANLIDADMRSADLSGANLSSANLRDANLRGADLKGAENVPYIPMICPEEGSFIGYKKASGKIIKLYIPEDAKRSSATTRKCRCNKAVVLAIYELDGSISKVKKVVSSRDHNFIYKINKEVVVDDFDDDRWNECSTGIHFFMQRQEAIDYRI